MNWHAHSRAISNKISRSYALSIDLNGIKAPVTQDGDHGDLGNPPDRRVIAKYQKNAPLCDCNRDRAALARRSDARPLWAQLRFHYDLCVSTTILRRPSAFHCIFGSIPWQAIMCSTHFYKKNENTRFFILKTNHDFIQVWIISFQISYDVNHKVINGQYWKLHMIVLFRSSWYKYHTRFRFYRVNFCYW